MTEQIKTSEPVGITLEQLKALFASTPTPEATPVAKHQAAAITSFEIAGLPVGEAIVGGIAGVLAGKAVNRVVPGVGVPVAEVIAAWLLASWGRNIPFVGSTGGKAAAIVLLADALRNALPVIDQTVNRIVAFIPSFGGLGGVARQAQSGTTNVVRRAGFTNI